MQPIDVANHLGAVFRRLDNREHEGKPARVVVATRVYDTTVDDLWDAVSNPERIPRWFLPVTGDLRLGGTYQLVGNAGGEIIRCEPPRVLGLTWVMGPSVSWVTVSLAEEPGGRARLELEHLAHVTDVGEEFWTRFGPGAVGVGWDLALRGLVLHLATRAQVDPKAYEAWTMSDEGKAFVRGTSEDWCRASIAAGTDPKAAKAAEANTTAAYTGAPPPPPPSATDG